MSQRPIPLALGTTALTLRGEMDALPLLVVIVEALKQSRLEAVLIGNAAAALRGAPVTTVDFDFFFRKTAANLKKLKTFAGLVGGRILKPYHPASDLYRVVNEDRGLQVDFLSTIHGVRSFAALRALAEPMAIGQTELWVASLKDIVASKKAAGRARDLAVVEILERTLREANKVENRKRKSPQAGECKGLDRPDPAPARPPREPANAFSAHSPPRGWFTPLKMFRVNFVAARSLDPFRALTEPPFTTRVVSGQPSVEFFDCRKEESF